MSTIDSATSGIIRINGQDVTRMKQAKLSQFRREELGFIFQDSNLLDTLTARENIALPLTIARTNSAEISTRVQDVAARLSISQVLDKYPYQMSGGQQQRVAAARALVTDPTMIMFLIMIVLLIAGCFLDNAVAVILLTPIFVNVVQAMNIDICYFGVFLVFVLAIGQVTPPVGLCLFVACDIGKVSIEKVSREVLPYVGGLIVTAILLVLFPQIVTWLPSLTKMA